MKDKDFGTILRNAHNLMFLAVNTKLAEMAILASKYCTAAKKTSLDHEIINAWHVQVGEFLNGPFM